MRPVSPSATNWPERCILGVSAVRFARQHAEMELAEAAAGRSRVSGLALDAGSDDATVRPGRARVLDSELAEAPRLALELVGCTSVLMYALQRDDDAGWLVSSVEAVQ